MSNYYLALGIERTANLNKIKQAYRICCKKYHPDSCSSGRNKQHFLKIQEAYETLSDEEKRKEYDRRLSEHASGESRPAQRETAASRRPRRSGQVRPFAGRSPFGSFTSLLDEFFGGFVPGFFDNPFSAEKELYAELVLSPDEARAGGELPVEIPVISECPSCRGRGSRGGGLCATCYGEGRVPTKRTLRLHVPAGIFDGAEARVSLEGIGIPGVFLNVDVTVSA
jgi:DnaJ-class molecular chaperone